MKNKTKYSFATSIKIYISKFHISVLVFSVYRYIILYKCYFYGYKSTNEKKTT